MGCVHRPQLLTSHLFRGLVILSFPTGRVYSTLILNLPKPVWCDVLRFTAFFPLRLKPLTAFYSPPPLSAPSVWESLGEVVLVAAPSTLPLS